MKQYTTPEQTAKLIELGLGKLRLLYFGNNTIGHYAYTIGELIEMLSNDDVATTRFEYDGFNWFVNWDSLDHMRQTSGVELIDALYDMVVKLKEDGVI